MLHLTHALGSSLLRFVALLFGASQLGLQWFQRGASLLLGFCLPARLRGDLARLRLGRQLRDEILLALFGLSMGRFVLLLHFLAQVRFQIAQTRLSFNLLAANCVFRLRL